MRHVRLSAVLGCSLALAGCGGSMSSTGTTQPPVQVTVHAVRDVAVLDAVSCASPGVCVAVGATSVDGTGVVVPITNGTPGAAHVVNGTKGLDAVSCPTTSFCEAVGAGSGQGMAVAISAGVPGPAVPVAGTSALGGVSCPSGPLCEAAGRSSGQQGIVVTLVSPTDILAPVPVALTTSVNGIDCPTTSLCQVVASTSNGHFNDVVASVVKGVPQPFRAASPSTSTFAGIACKGTVSCVAVGNGVHLVKEQNQPEAVVLSIANGVPGHLAGLSDSTTVHLEAVSCGTASHCVGVGTDGTASSGTASSRGTVVAISGGVPQPAQSAGPSGLALDGVSCPTASSCVAVGTNGTAQVLTLTG